MYVIKNGDSYVTKVEMGMMEGCCVYLTDNLALAIATKDLPFAVQLSHALDRVGDDTYEMEWVKDSEYAEALSDFLQHFENGQKQEEYMDTRDVILDILKSNS